MTEADKREINKSHVVAFLYLFASAELLWGLRTKHDAAPCASSGRSQRQAHM